MDATTRYGSPDWHGGWIAPVPTSSVRRLANALFLLAVLALNFTLMRPSPVDILFLSSAALSLIANQAVTRNLIILAVLLVTWTLCILVASLDFLGNPEVGLVIVKIGYAVSIGLCAALVASHWGPRDLRRFFQVFVLSATIGAIFGTIGFFTGSELLTWDGRAKGFLDDPNMFGAFLIPGLLAAIYLISTGGNRLVYAAAIATMTIGISLCFSRAAVVAFAVSGGLVFWLLNRRSILRASFFVLLGVAVVAVAVLVLSITVDDFADKLADRTTFAKDYDSVHGGRFSRYALSIPMILDNPLGIGILQWEHYFEEPIHNIWMSSFLNYGWIAGIAFTLLILFSVAIAARNHRSYGLGLTVVAIAWAAVLSCALLHEAERWRHLWLMTGLLWGLPLRNFVPVGAPAVRPPPVHAHAG